MWPYQLPPRGAGIGGLGDEFMAPNGAWEIEGEPYTTAPGSAFRWFRSRIEGGRTNHWGRIALRFAPADFKSCSTDGMGDAWPITYEDLAPYYDKVESYIGVFGSAASREWAKHWYDEIMPFLARNQVSRGAWRKTLG